MGCLPYNSSHARRASGRHLKNLTWFPWSWEVQNLVSDEHLKSLNTRAGTEASQLAQEQGELLWEGPPSLLLLTYEKLYTINIYNLMSLETSMYLWNHNHNRCCKPIQHLRKFPLILLFLLFVIRTLNKTSITSANFWVYRILLTIISTMLYNKPLGLIFFVTETLYPLIPPHFHLLPTTVTAISLSTLINLTLLDPSYKWYYVIFFLLCLTCFN